MKEQQERQTFEEKFGRSPLDLILRNPKLTPLMLFVLAVAPFFMAALIVGVVFLWN